jgi:hypothetical protein
MAAIELLGQHEAGPVGQAFLVMAACDALVGGRWVAPRPVGCWRLVELIEGRRSRHAVVDSDGWSSR